MKLFDRNTKAGFTLVELIVVIAILAILAGVAIPVYSGYIKKANKASDLMLLDAVNQAFAAACLENNAVPTGFGAGTELKIDPFTHCITGVTVGTYTASTSYVSGHAIVVATLGFGGNGLHFTNLSANPTGVPDSFDRYFAGNTGTPLQYFIDSEHEITFKNGVFQAAEDMPAASGGATLIGTPVDNGNGTKTYTFALANGEEASYTVAEADRNAFNASSFADMTIESLLGNVSNMTGAVGEVINDKTETGATYKILKSIYGAETDVDALLGLTKDPVTGEYDSAQLGNAVVLAVAQKTSESNNSSRDVLNNLTGAIQLEAMRNQVVTNAAAGDGGAIANLAMTYAMMTTYANSDAAKNEMITVGENTMSVSDYYTSQVSSLSGASGGQAAAQTVMDMANVMLTSTDSGFAQYIATDQAAADLDGYRGALNSIAANQTTLLEGNGVVSVGYQNEEISSILNTILGG